jgi:hypothetical protein
MRRRWWTRLLKATMLRIVGDPVRADRIGGKSDGHASP